MKIREISVLRGPNYWSNYRKKLIVMKLDIGMYEDYPTNYISGFTEKLTAMVPSLSSHRCSVGKEGGFITRMKEGTWLGHVVEHLALELQTLAGMDTGFGRTRSAGQRGVYHVVFSYILENAGLYAGKAAIRMVQALAAGRSYDLEADLQALRAILYEEGYGPSTQALVTAAEDRKIPVTRLDKESLVMLGYGRNQRIIRATIASTTSSIGVDSAGDKEETKRILGENYIPVPEGRMITDQEDLDEAVAELGYPLVIKPLDGNHGRGITTGIRNMETAVNGLILAKSISDSVIAEKHVEGDDYRLLVVNYKLIAVSKRTPASVTGDGTSTIEELIDQINQDPRRGDGHEKPLTSIKMDENTDSILIANQLNLKSVLSKGTVLKLKDTANISSGGTATDVTDLVHPYNKLMAERIARLIGLDICGIDIVASDIANPIGEGNGAVLEVNAAPGFRMHTHPSEGKARDVASPVIDMLFPPGVKPRIPVVAVTGTNGKTTTTRLIAHLGQAAGYTPGFTCTDGIYIGGNVIAEGDCSGPGSAAIVLRDPLVDLAVLECARGGILRSGLGFDHCEVSVVTNISEDHLGLNGIHDLEELARVKSVVPRSTFDHGYAILNADDDRVFAMHEDLSANIALFCTDPENLRVRAHIEDNGIAAVVENGEFVLYRGTARVSMLPVREAPITLDGKAACMIKNALAALLAATCLGIPDEQIRSGLRSFAATPDMIPGRMNVFDFDKFRVIVDYAHNTGGYQELKDFLRQDDAAFKTGIIAATGDRRDEDIILLGEYASEIFDELIIRHDKDGRGRTNDNITKLLLHGIRKKNQNKPVSVISDEIAAIEYAIENAGNDALIFVSSDDLKNTIGYVTEKLKSKNLVSL
jgi:cyanophycin synthetase